ncbi:trehalose-phosphatase [Acinetobacter halotolerans]|uniref:Trehalose 6-phosphate phosphatase n=1 Tax=Acinetobacter halotolerans TaxID=1752076 RepID=A0A4Q6XEB0_9GAMM|nr:trehalose-phosphatase [Acinetobacter halotolerans]RZF55866.1 trehalose-phosphatase [Acinetobacter halotolerans]
MIYKSKKNESSSDNLENLRADLALDHRKKCLFLDIDGTLCDFKINPNDCFIPSNTLFILDKILSYNIPVIAVTGRDFQSAHKLFKYINLPIAALHGSEIYLSHEKKIINSKKSLEISHIYKLLVDSCSPYPHFFIENKTTSIALHYRKCPELHENAKKIILEIHELFPHLKLIEGKFVFELISAEANKGLAIGKILALLNQTEIFTPIFIGDDQTDEDGFYFVNHYKNGISIKVGDGLTHAKHRLRDINQVYDFFSIFLEHIQNDGKNNLSSNNLSGEKTCLN